MNAPKFSADALYAYLWDHGTREMKEVYCVQAVLMRSTEIQWDALRPEERAALVPVIRGMIEAHESNRQKFPPREVARAA